MDIISHGLWTGALSKIVKIKKKKFNFWWTAFWGMFPDVFAFVIPGVIFFFVILFQTGFNFSNWSSIIQSSPYLNIIEMLYSISHSLIIFSAVFLLIWLIFKKPVWIMFGWLLHILIDIPTHKIEHFATPFLWPISNFKIDGLIYWREPLFMIVDIVLLIVVYGILFLRKNGEKRK